MKSPDGSDPSGVIAHPSRSARDRLASLLVHFGTKWQAQAEPLDLTARALVFAPHPDDEVLGCGGTIALKRMAGAPVRVVVMTDGRTSHANFIDAEALIRMRRAEAHEASRPLGLAPQDYAFLDFADSRLREHAVAAQRQVVEILRRFEPVQVFVPHRRDRLPDHVATFEIVTSAIRAQDKRVTVLEYPVWLWNTWPWSAAFPRWRSILPMMPRMIRDGAELALACRTRIDIQKALAHKRLALTQYRSQVLRMPGEPRWPTLSDVSEGTFVNCFFTGVEVFRRTEHVATTGLPTT